MEAHHLVPMSQQGSFEYSLDVPSNVVALCALCHKLLHHGRAADKREHLLKLFEVRKAMLHRSQIKLDFNALFRLYSYEVIEDD